MSTFLFLYVALFAAFTTLELTRRNRDLPKTGNAKTHSQNRIFVNFGMSFLISALAATLPFSIFSSARLAETNGWGMLNKLSVEPGLFSGVLIFASAFLVRTFLSYWIHRVSHGVPLLWRLHRIHHNDTILDVSVAFRHHPLEYLIALAVIAPAVIILGLPAWAVLAAEACIIFGLFFEHADIVLPARLTRPLSRYLSTPEIHEIHHSAHQPQTDSNYGAFTIIWDRLFGTYTPPLVSPPRIGLGNADDAISDKFLKLLLLPFGKQPQNSTDVQNQTERPE